MKTWTYISGTDLKMGRGFILDRLSHCFEKLNTLLDQFFFQFFSSLPCFSCCFLGQILHKKLEFKQHFLFFNVMNSSSLCKNIFCSSGFEVPIGLDAIWVLTSSTSSEMVCLISLLRVLDVPWLALTMMAPPNLLVLGRSMRTPEENEDWPKISVNS